MCTENNEVRFCCAGAMEPFLWDSASVLPYCFASEMSVALI